MEDSKKVYELEVNVETLENQQRHFDDETKELSDSLICFERRVYVLEKINMGVGVNNVLLNFPVKVNRTST